MTGGRLTDLRPPSGSLVRVGRWHVVVHPRTALVSGLLIVVTLGAAIYAMTIGTLDIGAVDVFRALFHAGDASDVRVVNSVRLPRTLTAALAGAALAVSGSVLQSVSRNALGSPEIVGFTTGAATGAIMQIVVYQAGDLQVALGAFVGGVLTAVVVYLLSVKGGTTGGYQLILTGIGVGAVLQAVNDFLLAYGGLDEAVQANVWRAGSLSLRGWGHVTTVGVACLVLIPVVGVLAKRASIMEMGDDLAAQLGVRTGRTRLVLVFTAVFLAAAATAACGPIAFVALAAPQLVNRLTGSQSVSVVGAAAMGACLLVVSDIVSQTLPVQAAVPIGRVTGVIGGMYLIWLLTRKDKVRV
ncbi:FecCD family ABC transporter permease [Gordonia sp. (in: high G+C Gram-positive bacteria)]|uniref:FecCD family ABC transporter permease n=1 Tax=Gordonia sp. (in: high G+C Gram-positive bacteria) TaxID=84139 RepID=UPI003F9B1157